MAKENCLQPGVLKIEADGWNVAASWAAVSKSSWKILRSALHCGNKYAMVCLNWRLKNEPQWELFFDYFFFRHCKKGCSALFPLAQQTGDVTEFAAEEQEEHPGSKHYPFCISAFLCTL